MSRDEYRQEWDPDAEVEAQVVDNRHLASASEENHSEDALSMPLVTARGGKRVYSKASRHESERTGRTKKEDAPFHLKPDP